LSFTTYYERRQVVRKDEARRLEELLAKKTTKEPRNVLTRRLKFDNLTPLPDEGRYSICMMDFDPEQIYLELKYVQKGITYKKLTKLTENNCISVLEGNVEWMEASKDKLIQGFYRQMLLNNIRPGNVIETCKSVYCWKADYISLKRSVRSIRNNGYNFFDPNTYMIQCLDYDKVELNQKQAVTLPRFIETVLYGTDDVGEDMLAFVI